MRPYVWYDFTKTGADTSMFCHQNNNNNNYNNNNNNYNNQSTLQLLFLIVREVKLVIILTKFQQNRYK